MLLAFRSLAVAFAAATPPEVTAPTDIAGWFQTGGFFALSAVLLLFAKTAYKRETDRSDRLEKRNEDQVVYYRNLLDEKDRFFRDQAFPAMRDSADALREATAILRDYESRRRRGSS